MSSESKPKLYTFDGSCWAQVPRLAIEEAGFKEEAIEQITIVLAEGENFNPDFLKINPKGTVPALEINGKVYDDSTSVTEQILKIAPHPPRVSAYTSTSIVAECHAEEIDPNVALVTSRSDEEREAKKNSLPGQFVKGRLGGLEKYAAKATGEQKEFIEGKLKDARALNAFYQTDVDEETRKAHYAQTEKLWQAVGDHVRGNLTRALKKNGGPFAAGDQPADADFHIIAWLARILTCLGAKQGAPSSDGIVRLRKATGGLEIDDAVSKYWDAWIKRDSFQKVQIN